MTDVLNMLTVGILRVSTLISKQKCQWSYHRTELLNQIVLKVDNNTNTINEYWVLRVYIASSDHLLWSLNHAQCLCLDDSRTHLSLAPFSPFDLSSINIYCWPKNHLTVIQDQVRFPLQILANAPNWFGFHISNECKLWVYQKNIKKLKSPIHVSGWRSHIQTGAHSQSPLNIKRSCHLPFNVKFA